MATTRSTKSGPGRYRRSLEMVLQVCPRSDSASSPRIDSSSAMSDAGAMAMGLLSPRPCRRFGGVRLPVDYVPSVARGHLDMPAELLAHRREDLVGIGALA